MISIWPNSSSAISKTPSKARLQRRARRNGRSMEEEVRDIFARRRPQRRKEIRIRPWHGVGGLFADVGLDEPIQELRGLKSSRLPSKNDHSRHKCSVRVYAAFTQSEGRRWLDRQPRSSLWTTAITIFEIRLGCRLCPTASDATSSAKDSTKSWRA